MGGVGLCGWFVFPGPDMYLSVSVVSHIERFLLLLGGTLLLGFVSSRGVGEPILCLSVVDFSCVLTFF